MTTHVVHKDDCMCDECIRLRVKERVMNDAAEAAQQPYLERRGAPIGGVSVSEALKQRKPRS